MKKFIKGLGYQLLLIVVGLIACVGVYGINLAVDKYCPKVGMCQGHLYHWVTNTDGCEEHKDCPFGFYK